MFSAHGIDVFVGAENHAGMLAGLGGCFLSLDIWVDDEDSEEAEALLRDLRERDDRGVPGDDDDDDYDGDETGEGAQADAGNSMQLRIDRRRRTAVAVLLGSCITFGTAHMFTGAWMRGATFAAVETAGLVQIGRGHPSGAFAAVAAILADLIGALWRVRVVPRSALPVARLRSP